MRDLFKQPLSREELHALSAHASVDALFSWKSPTARQRGLTPGTLSEEQMLDLMAEEPRLIRRPLTLHDGTLIIGADLKRLAELV